MSRLRNANISAVPSCEFVSRDWQFPVQMAYFILLLSLAECSLNALNGDKAKDRRYADGKGVDGSIAGGRGISSIPQDPSSFQRTNQSARESRTSFENWFINEIKDFILNATGRGNGSHHAAARDRSDPAGESTRRGPGGLLPYGDEWTPGRPPQILPTTKAHRSTDELNRVEEIKFPPDEVSTHRNDAFVQFTLRNYTAKRVEGAELMLLLRYNPPVNHHQQPITGHRRPEVRRITIEVYKDNGNETHDGNSSSSSSSSSSQKSPMTKSVFRIRRTKWVNVLLIRSWIKEAVASLDKVLRLHLVYDRSEAVDVVLTNREKRRKRKERPETEAERPRRKLREGFLSRRNNEQRITKRTLRKRKRRSSPILVIRQRVKSTS